MYIVPYIIILPEEYGEKTILDETWLLSKTFFPAEILVRNISRAPIPILFAPWFVHISN